MANIHAIVVERICSSRCYYSLYSEIFCSFDHLHYLLVRLLPPWIRMGANIISLNQVHIFEADLLGSYGEIFHSFDDLHYLLVWLLPQWSRMDADIISLKQLHIFCIWSFRPIQFWSKCHRSKLKSLMEFMLTSLKQIKRGQVECEACKNWGGSISRCQVNELQMDLQWILMAAVSRFSGKMTMCFSHVNIKDPKVAPKMAIKLAKWLSF